MEEFGDWFFPHSPEELYKGFFKGDEGELVLYGNFLFNGLLSQPAKREVLRNLDVICGTTRSGKKITIVKPFQNGFNSSFNGNDEVKFSVLQFFVGEHFLNLSDIKFSSVNFKLSGAVDWFNKVGFKMESDGSNFCLEYTSPEALKVHLNATKTLVFTWQLNKIATFKHRKNFEQQLVISLKSKSVLNVEEHLFNIAQLEVLFSLLMYQQISCEEICFYLVEGEKGVNYFQIDKDVKDSFDRKNALLFPINFEKVKGDFPVLIKNWIDKFHENSHIYEILYDLIANKSKFSTNNFLNVAQALESFHAVNHNKLRLTKQKYNELIQGIKGKLEDHEIMFFKNAFDFGNHPNLDFRLNDLFDLYGGKLTTKLFNREETLRSIKQTRNYYTHYGKKGKSVWEAAPLYYNTQKLKYFITFAVLVNNGLDKDTLDESFLIYYNQKLTHLNGY